MRATSCALAQSIALAVATLLHPLPKLQATPTRDWRKWFVSLILKKIGLLQLRLGGLQPDNVISAGVPPSYTGPTTWGC